MKQVGIAWMAYLTDFGGAGAAGAGHGGIDWEELGLPTSSLELTAALVPEYLPQVPETDGWGYPFQYRLEQDVALGIGSGGADGAFEGRVYAAGFFSVTDYDQDIVWFDGTFIRAPETRP